MPLELKGVNVSVSAKEMELLLLEVCQYLAVTLPGLPGDNFDHGDAFVMKLLVISFKSSTICRIFSDPGSCLVEHDTGYGSYNDEDFGTGGICFQNFLWNYARTHKKFCGPSLQDWILLAPLLLPKVSHRKVSSNSAQIYGA